jgi:hypothetical protein
MKDVGIFFGHLVHFTVFCYILLTFGIVHGNLVYFPPVLVFCTKKNLATLVAAQTSNAPFSGGTPDGIEWKRATELSGDPHLFVDGATRFDINQGPML